MPSSHGVRADPKASSRALSRSLHLNAQERKLLRRIDTGHLQSWKRSLCGFHAKSLKIRERGMGSISTVLPETNKWIFCFNNSFRADRSQQHSLSITRRAASPLSACNLDRWTASNRSLFCCREGHNGKSAGVTRGTDTFDDGKEL